jgi:hypothetical protein
MFGMSVYFEFRVEFDERMYEGLREPSGVIAVCFSYFFVGVMKPMKPGRTFMYDRKYNEERHVTGVYLGRVKIEDSVKHWLKVKRRVKYSVVICRCGDLLTKQVISFLRYISIVIVIALHPIWGWYDVGKERICGVTRFYS